MGFDFIDCLKGDLPLKATNCSLICVKLLLTPLVALSSKRRNVEICSNLLRDTTVKKDRSMVVFFVHTFFLDSLRHLKAPKNNLIHLFLIASSYLVEHPSFLKQ